jgi:hypothetical protein
MTADRFGPTSTGEYTALRSMRGPARAPDGIGEQMLGSPDPQALVPPLPSVGPPPGSGAVGAGAARASGRVRPWLPALPPQHGAWAFLIVPVLSAFALAGTSPAGWLLLAAWVCAYPIGYYGGRALSARARRGSWTRRARRELVRAIPWAALTALLGLPLVFARPWLLLVALALAVLWGAGLAVAARLGERSMANDLLLVAQALAAVPLTVAVVAGPDSVTGPLAGDTAGLTALMAVYLTGSVLHVKSLLREADRPAFRWLDVAWHGVAAVLAALASPWWLVGFAPALIRSVVLRPGLRPGVIGGVEAGVAVLVVMSAFAALPPG